MTTCVDDRAVRVPFASRLGARLRRALPLLLPFLAVLAAINAGHAGSRAWQVLVLALPGWFWLWWPMRTPRRRRVQGLLCLALGLSFVLDGAVRGFLLSAYDALPNSSMVLSAVANTTPGESREFVAMYWRDIVEWTLFAFLCGAILVAGIRLWWRAPPRLPEPRGWRIAIAVLMLALILGSLVSKPWRRHHPALFWPQWAQDIGDLRRQWGELGQQRQRLLAAAAKLAPTLADDSPDTLVLVISESMNRNNLSSYGYARPTSPALFARQRELGERMEVFRHAWSVNASTVPALRSLFYFGKPEDRDRVHLLALARAAGYRTWWISNHNDLAIEQEHARLADTVEVLNRKPGRSSEALDEQLLPAMKTAMADKAPRKLIVLHMLGLHPDYRMRHPAGMAFFAQASDQVDARLRREGRPGWLRDMRNDYDSAVRYHDKTVAATLDLSRHAPGKQMWVFLSDHGQEVGHSIDRAGHSATTPDGYRIPLMVWSSYQDTAPGSRLNLPVRGDWLAHSLTNLLGIEWNGDQPRHDVFDARYRWQPPRMPLRIDFNS